VPTIPENGPCTLFSPFEMAGLELKNRVVMSPLTRSRAGVERMANGLMAEYYSQRASVGMIITEATVVSKQGIGWLNSPGIYTDEQAEAWKIVVSAVHAKGTPIFLQLWHCGRASHTSFHEEEGLPVAPSAIRMSGDDIHAPIGKVPLETPRALETEEIPSIVEDYRRAAARAMKAGFDGVEIHAANGYLIDQFLQSKTNHRTDCYGGSTENRPAGSACIFHPTAISTTWGRPIFARHFSMRPDSSSNTNWHTSTSWMVWPSGFTGTENR
jgi:N-ethylmaleimide reductase